MTTLRSRQIFAIRPLLPLAACAGLLVGCAGTGAMAPPEPVTSRSLADDYILVHGMAAGALTTDGVSEASYTAMVTLDHDALLAVGASVTNPASDTAKAQAQAAIGRLVDYASAVGAGTSTQAPSPSAR